MEHLWSIKLRKCSYSTLEFEFINFFETNDKRTVERYLGRPEQTIYSKGSISTVRINQTTGKIAQFQYSNVRRVPRIVGLLETLGYITLKPEEKIIDEGSVRITKKTKNWEAVLHHERMSYYTEQATLEGLEVPSQTLLQEPNDDECSRVSESKPIMCVSPLLEEKSESIHSCGERVGGKTALEVVPQIEAKEKEEEVIDSTHTQIIGLFGEAQNPLSTLIEEEANILTAKPGEEPDKSTPIRRVPSG